MEKSKSIISWGQLFIIFGTACLFLFALTQRVVYTPPKEIVYITDYEFNSGAIISYSGDDEVLNIPSSYSLGPTKEMKGTITFNTQSEAFDFLNDVYATGASGYYEFYQTLLTHEYPWTYEYSIDIPSFIEGTDFAVTSIRERTFSENKKIKKVCIPSSIKSIRNFAFQNCTNLTEIEIEEGLTFIGDSAFWGCSFKEIKLPNSLEIVYPYAFFDCKKLETITIPKNVKDLTLGTFNGCDNLQIVTLLPETEVKIWTTEAYQIFSRCPNLTTIFVPESKLEYYKTTSPWSLYSSKYKSL